jgi:hypothetical protein
MMRRTMTRLLPAACLLALLAPPPAFANGWRAQGKPATIADSALTVTPSRDWNRLALTPGKQAEIWTLDGEALNAITFYAGIEPGKPLIREVSRKRKPLPKYRKSTLLVEVPELFEGTYRASRDLAAFALTGARPDRFLGQDGIRFTFDYIDDDNLPRRGEARAAIVDDRLYMAAFSAPRLHYYERTLADFRALTDSARLAHAPPAADAR